MSVAERGSKTRLAKELGVSRASLYYRRKLPEKDELLRREIERVMVDNPGYGSPRVAIALEINKKRAARVMRKYGLKPARRAGKPCKPNDQGREPTGYPCALSDWCPAAPNVLWASDFTFISFRGEFIYLCTVLDGFTGEVLGFNISRTHDAEFVRRAIERAQKYAGTLPEWFHSDQGSEYASGAICSWLESQGVKISMNPKGAPWCNGSQESFFGRFKVEFGDFERFETRADLLEEIYKQLHYHSAIRIKTRLKMSPVQFREKWEAGRTELSTITNNFPQVMSLPRRRASLGSPLPPLRGGEKLLLLNYDYEQS